MPQFQLGRMVVAASLAALLYITGSAVTPLIFMQPADIYLSPKAGQFKSGDIFTLQIKVRSEVPTNVYAGRLLFDPTVLQVEKIDYNISIADLWAVLPWYSNGNGTLTFAGGTTREGGFVGEETLITVTFKATEVGEAHLMLVDARVLKHDGLGTYLELSDATIDAIFTVSPEELIEETVSAPVPSLSRIEIVNEKPSTDLNGDGEQGFADISVFMVHLANKNLRSDLNGDGKVSLSDLSILLNANK